MNVEVAIDAFRLVGEPRTSGAFVVSGFTRELEKSNAIRGITLLLPRSPGKDFMFNDLLSLSKVDIVYPPKPYFPEQNFRSQVHWIQVVIPALLKNRRISHMIAPYHQTPVFLPRSIKVATIICDICGILPSAGYYYHKKGPYRHWFNFLTALWRADAFIYISEHTKHAFERAFPVARKRPSVVIYPLAAPYLPLGQNEARNVLGELGLEDKEYFFAFGHGGKRKGFDLVIQSFELYQRRGGMKKLVVLVPSSIRKQVEDSIPPALHNIKFLSNLSALELNAVYWGAIALVFPSRCEGFGYPVLEAMVQGCPPIAWDHSPAKEIVAETVPMLKTLKPEEIADFMAAYERQGPDNRQVLAHTLIERAFKFIGQVNVAEKYIELLNQTG